MNIINISSAVHYISGETDRNYSLDSVHRAPLHAGHRGVLERELEPVLVSLHQRQQQRVQRTDLQLRDTRGDERHSSISRCQQAGVVVGLALLDERGCGIGANVIF